jgi:hypothetical protein
MKPFIITNHCIEQYAARTSRDILKCSEELANSIMHGTVVDVDDVYIHGFTLTKVFRGDTFCIWYDPKIDDELLAIIAKDGAVKTVLRKKMYTYIPKGVKCRYDRKGDTLFYGNPKKSRKRGKTRVR